MAKEKIKQFPVYLPEKVFDDFTQRCKDEYISKTKWVAVAITHALKQTQEKG